MAAALTLAMPVPATSPKPGVVGDRRRDDALLVELFRSHGPMVHRRALRLLGSPADAEEATQEVFIRVMISLGRFERRAEMSTWLFRICTNYCLNRLRDEARRRELWEQVVVPDAQAHGASSAVSVDILVMRALLADADEREARAALYVYVDGMSHREAAAELNVSARTVGNLLDRFQSWAARRLSAA